MEPPRWWTVDDANAALGWVTERVEQARSLLGEARRRTQRAADVVRSNGHGALPADLTPIGAVVEELRAQGIVLRDLDQGLLDFPARTADGRPYWLCWVVGEPEVAWWHWLDTGFAGRTPLDRPPG